MRIKIDYRGDDGKRGWLEVDAEEFTIPGVTEHQFAVHRSPEHPEVFVATHVGTGFAMARSEAKDEAIESAIKRWLEHSPEQLALVLIRAKNQTGVRGEKVTVAA